MALLQQTDLPDLTVIAADLHEDTIKVALLSARLTERAFNSPCEVLEALDTLKAQNKALRGQVNRMKQAIDAHRDHWVQMTAEVAQ